MPSPLRLTARDLAVSYGASFTLSGLNFEAHGGDLVGLVGPNGAGKSTALKSIAGVLPRIRGEILLNGQPLVGSRQSIAFVPQREEVNWEFPVSAGDVVLMGRYRAAGWLRRPGRRDRTLAEEALESLGLGGAAGRHISQFSGGQQQRIFLARALAQEPQVVLLDEPYTGIDIANRETLHAVIERFRSAGAIVLMATHDLEEVRRSCSHVLLLNRRQVAFGPVAATFTVENLKAAFGGTMAVFA